MIDKYISNGYLCFLLLLTIFAQFYFYFLNYAWMLGINYHRLIERTNLSLSCLFVYSWRLILMLTFCTICFPYPYLLYNYLRLTNRLANKAFLSYLIFLYCCFLLLCYLGNNVISRPVEEKDSRALCSQKFASSTAWSSVY